MARSGDDFAKYFQAKLLHQLGEPVLLEVLNPLVLEAKEYAANRADGGVTVVGAAESALLNAPPNKKYPIYLFVDALCRSSSAFNFRAQFSRNLEHIFPVSCNLL